MESRASYLSRYPVSLFVSWSSLYVLIASNMVQEIFEPYFDALYVHDNTDDNAREKTQRLQEHSLTLCFLRFQILD